LDRQRENLNQIIINNKNEVKSYAEKFIQYESQLKVLNNILNNNLGPSILKLRTSIFLVLPDTGTKLDKTETVGFIPITHSTETFRK